MIPAVRDEEAARVEAYLRAHPGFLAARPGLYALLLPPRRVHGENLADHMAAMIEAGRAEWRSVLAAGRTRGHFGARVAEAVLALIAAADPRAALSEECPALLGLAQCALRPLAPAQPLLLRDVAQGEAALHGEAAPLIRREALLAVGGETLVLGAREPETLPNEPETMLFLARALAALLDR
jgi:hypothetical protein